MSSPAPPAAPFSLILRCAVPLRRGVGQAAGVPLLRLAGRDYSARAVSQALDAGQVVLEGRAFSRSVLAAAGIGPSGRYIDGAPIVPVRIRPREALCRGGKDLEGFWSAFEFPEERWIRNGGPALFAAHLDFLRSFGISGGVAVEREEGAELLAAYLASLEGKIEDGRALALVPAEYYENCLRRRLSPAVPVGASEGGSLFAPRFRGAGLVFYGDLPGNLDILKPRFDILILVEPEGAIPRLPLIREISARVILGVFTGAGDLLAPGPHPLKGFFSLRGNMAELAGYCIRNIREDLPLPPRYQFEKKTIRRPPRPFARSEDPDLSALGIPGQAGSGGGLRAGGPDALGGDLEDRLVIAGGGRFIIQYKFKHIRTPEYAEERACFFARGRRTSRELRPPEEGCNLGFEDLNKKQRDYFFYWRDSFRNGRSLKTCAAYIVIYARELILCLGGGGDSGGAEENFRELFRLWRSCRENFPVLDGVFPQWLLDFAVLYKRMDLFGEKVLPLAAGTDPPILRDLALHRRHIENDGPISFGDVQLLLHRELASNRFYTSLYGPLLEMYAERALNALDCSLGIFNSFYPAGTSPVLIRAFPLLDGLGQSSYSAEWIRFSDHPPLKALFRSVLAYVEYQLRRQTAFPGILRKAGIDPGWKEAIDAELGFPGETAVKPIKLEDHKLDQLRDESDAVRELLRMEKDGFQDEAEPQEEPVLLPPRRGLPEPAEISTDSGRDGSASALTAFLAGLPAAEREILGCITRGAAAGKLRELALKHGSMPELLTDSLNAAFQETFGDLLVETLDEGPSVSAEYRAGVKRFFET